MSRKDLFVIRILDQIHKEEQYGKILDQGKIRLDASKYLIPIPIAALILGTLIRVYLGVSPDTPLLLWIVGSFFVYMFYFFLMMLPSLGSDSSIHYTDKKSQFQIREFLRLANLLKTFRNNSVTFVETVWNAFLINAKPLAKGFGIIYLSDLVVAIFLQEYQIISTETFLLITAQVVVILAFYTKIYFAEPDTPGFFVGKAFTEENAGRPKAQLWLYLSIFLMFTGFLIIGAMLFPGLTLTHYLSDIALIPTEYPIILAFVLFTQGIILRYFQGVDSRNLMQTLNIRHLSVLKDDLYPRVIAEKDEELDGLYREYLLLSMNKLVVQEFFKRFPAYALMPNFLIIGDPAAREILDKTTDEKSIREIL